MLKNPVSQTILHYVDAQFPLLYLNTFEETKVDSLIKSVAYGREILEWNASKGFVHFETKSPLLDSIKTVEEILYALSQDDELNGKILVLKDIHHFLDNPHVISTLKEIALKIYNGLETVLFLVSPVLKIPTELEKYITIIEIGYLEEQDVKQLIRRFLRDNQLPDIADELLDELTIAFKGLTEYEIVNILSLAYSKDGDLTKKDLELIYDQKFQVIKKSGILEMIPQNETRKKTVLPSSLQLQMIFQTFQLSC
ncbi:hypothetical protein AB4Z21_26440 [Paenibacillus sp. MCAF20]